MKKLLAIVLSVLMLVAAVPFAVGAQELVVPDGTTEIADRQYAMNNSITSVVIPGTVKRIGQLAFFNCTNLETVVIKAGVETIDAYAFQGCSALKTIVFEEGVKTIGAYAFENCTSLTSIVLPDSLEKLGYTAFGGCINLKTVDLGNGIKEIGGYVFSGCNVEVISIPESVTSIDENAFAYIAHLPDIYYGGTEEQWEKVFGNIDGVTIHYNSDGNEPSIPKTASTTYHGVTATLDSSYFEKDSITYNHELGRFCSLFTVIGYNDKTTIASRLEDCGFTVDGNYIVKNASQEQVNNFITHKKVIVNGKEHTLIFAGYIGSHKKQWYSNFDPGRGTTHKGFTNAKNYVYSILENYIKDLGISKDETIILLTGHSRGAATTNLVAKQLIDDEKYANKENIYAYAFATPNSTSLSERKDYIYKRIFNIVNPEDLVTKMIPAAWGYGKYGKTYTLPSKTNTSASSYKAYKANMEVTYKLLLGGESYHPYPAGEEQTYNIMSNLTGSVKDINQFYDKKFSWLNTLVTVQQFMTDTLCKYQATSGQEKEEAQSLLLKTFGTTILNSELIFKLAHYFVVYQGIGSVTEGWFMDDYFQEAHQAETYCAYMMSMSEGQIKTTRKGYQGSVNCPVDVEIYDNETGELVGRIVNNVVDEEIAAKENSVVMGVEGDSKTFWLPSDGDYEIKLIGNDEGTMDYTLSEVDSDEGEVSRVNFFDVEITESKTMTADVEAETFAIEEHVLNCEEEIIEPDENSAEEEIEVYDIEITATAGGYVSESQTAKSGDYVSLVATPEEEWELVGWFENGELISTESEIAFVAKSDRTFTVEFKHNHTFEKETIDSTCTETGSLTYTCTCGDTYTETIPALGHTASSWITDLAPTCSAEGSKHIECTVCGETLKTEPIAKLPHTYNSVVTKATCETGGYTTYTCTCGDTYTDDKTPAKGHNYVEGVCENCGESKVDNCTHLCHKSGFLGFIWKIVRFIIRLFRVTPVCSCGISHY